MAMKDEEGLLNAIDGEFAYQDQRWGSGRINRSQDEWILYMHDYMQEAIRQTTRGDEVAALHTVRKIVAMGIRCLLQHGVLRRLGF